MIMSDSSLTRFSLYTTIGVSLSVSIITSLVFFTVGCVCHSLKVSHCKNQTPLTVDEQNLHEHNRIPLPPAIADSGDTNVIYEDISQGMREHSHEEHNLRVIKNEAYSPIVVT